MNISKCILSLLCAATLALTPSSLLAEPAPETLALDFKLLPVDHPGNPADANCLGKVDANFQIAKYDTTAKQYCAFLNAVETTGAHGFYHPEMGSDPAIKCISQSLGEDGIHFIYNLINDDCAKLPITYTSWIDAVCFCNWLHHDCPTGDAVTDEVLYDGAYRFSKNGEEQVIELMPGARYFLPDRNQFHKAAFYRRDLDRYWDYPTRALSPLSPGNTIGSSANQANYYYTSYFWGNSHSTKGPLYITPVGSFSGSPGPFGTYDMGANVKNWSSDFNEDGNALAEGGSWKTTYEMLRNDAPDTPLDPTMGHDDVGFRIAAPAPIIDETASAQQDNKTDAPSSVINGLKAAGSASEWTLWNIGGEVVEAIVFQQLGLYALLPYCAYMGAVILHEYENQEYYGAAGTIVHALFDIACMLGDKIGFDVAGILGSCLEKCGLKCVADFFGTIHEGIDSLLHALGIEHSHGAAVENAELEQALRQEIANGLETFANGASPSAPPAATTTVPKALPGAGWGHRHNKSCTHTK
ncbi:MAG: formylglycine-generating enzyme family protein [Chthoniobacterales bacterium]|nr:formylglycine-generating enzyme family protein [Chthoniobacterales bacterium]